MLGFLLLAFAGAVEGLGSVLAVVAQELSITFVF